MLLIPSPLYCVDVDWLLRSWFHAFIMRLDWYIRCPTYLSFVFEDVIQAYITGRALEMRRLTARVLTMRGGCWVTEQSKHPEGQHKFYCTLLFERKCCRFFNLNRRRSSIHSEEMCTALCCLEWAFTVEAANAWHKAASVIGILVSYSVGTAPRKEDLSLKEVEESHMPVGWAPMKETCSALVESLMVGYNVKKLHNFLKFRSCFYEIFTKCVRHQVFQ